MIELLTPELFVQLLGILCAVLLGTMGLLALLVMPMMRLSALVMAAARWLVGSARQLSRPRADDPTPWRPLNLGGLSGPLSRLVRQTRTLALELRDWCTRAVDWSAESSSQALPRSGWRESLLGGLDGRAPLTAIRGDVFAWLGLVETLRVDDRELLTGLGVDVEGVRRALTEECAPAEMVRALAGLLWSADERLAAASTFGYRASQAEPATAASPGARVGAVTSDSDDEQTRRRRWAGTIAEHGPGLSRMAASYTRGTAERADLEQDIALALWRALPMFRGESSLKTFAYRVARYCCFRHVRRRKDVDATVDPASVADPAACIESAILCADQRARIEQALTDLPDNLESVLSLHLTGHSYTQIAEILGITERNVSVRLSRARARLRRQLVAA